MLSSVKAIRIQAALCSLSMSAFVLSACNFNSPNANDSVEKKIQAAPLKSSSSPELTNDKNIELALDEVRRQQSEIQKRFEGYPSHFLPHMLPKFDVVFDPVQPFRSFEIPMDGGKLTLTIPENWYIGHLVPGNPRAPYGTAFIPDVESYSPKNIGLSLNTPDAFVSIFSSAGFPKYSDLARRDFFQKLDLDKFFTDTKCDVESYCDITSELSRINPLWEKDSYPKGGHQVPVINSSRLLVLRGPKGAQFKYLIKIVDKRLEYNQQEQAISCDTSSACIQIFPKTGKTLPKTVLLSTVQYLDSVID